MVAQELGRLDEAMRFLEQALYLDQDFVMAHFALGNVAKRLGRYALSRRHFRSALSLMEGLEPDVAVPESAGLTAGRLMEIIRLSLDGESRETMSVERIDWTEIHRRMAAAEAAIAHVGWASRDETRAVLKARAEALARESDEGASARELLEVVSFLLGQEKYGVETRYVREVCPMNELTPLPGTPPFVLGVVNVRGQVLSVIDIGKLFDLPQRGVGDLDRIIRAPEWRDGVRHAGQLDPRGGAGPR